MSYAPEPVPNIEGNEQLRQWLTSEFEKIQSAVNLKPDIAFGGLNLVGGNTTQQVGLTPVLYVAFDNVAPNRPVNVLPNATTDGLTVLTAGVYLIQFVANLVNLPVNGQFIFELFINGVGTTLQVAVDPSNQTSQMFMIGSGLLDAARGDLLQVFVSSDLDFRTLETQTCSFYSIRVSASFD